MEAGDRIVDTGVNWEFHYEVEWVEREGGLCAPSGLPVAGFAKVKDIGRWHKFEEGRKWPGDRASVLHGEFSVGQWLRVQGELWMVEIE